MKNLIHPILRDVQRILERHPDLSWEFKLRLLNGLAEIDEQVAADQSIAPHAPLPKAAKGAKA